MRAAVSIGIFNMKFSMTGKTNQKLKVEYDVVSQLIIKAELIKFSKASKTFGEIHAAHISDIIINDVIKKAFRARGWENVHFIEQQVSDEISAIVKAKEIVEQKIQSFEAIGMQFHTDPMASGAYVEKLALPECVCQLDAFALRR